MFKDTQQRVPVKTQRNVKIIVPIIGIVLALITTGFPSQVQSEPLDDSLASISDLFLYSTGPKNGAKEKLSAFVSSMRDRLSTPQLEIVLSIIRDNYGEDKERKKNHCCGGAGGPNR